MDKIILFIFLILFPFGQIIRFGIIQPIDIVVGIGALYVIFKRLDKPSIFKHVENFLLIAGFTWVVSIFFFGKNEVLYGLLYLVRLISYSYFLILVWNFASTKINRDLLVNSLLSLSLFSALFGWIQFFTIPDIKPFFIYGWDEHMFRLVGTFLDPTFLGLIIVFGLLITIHRFTVIKERKYIWMGIFLLISLAFTYSRASYLAFGAGLLLLSLSLKNIKQTLLIIITLLLLIIFLPTSKNHSIEFFRSLSALARIDNYSQTLKIFNTSPLLGVGYNNMCAARNKYIGPESFSSHACSGSDSSLLLILTTTGVIGFISFIYLIYQIWKETRESSYFLILDSLFLSLLVHSLFSNSIFYSWIMGYMIIILALSLRCEVKN